MNSVHFVTQRK